MGSSTQPEEDEARHRTGPFGPSVVLFAALAALAVATRSVDRGSRSDSVAPRGAAPEADVGVWLGHNTKGLVVRLSPLSREAGRQAFDAKALAERFGLEPGQPFRLECCAHLPEGHKPKRELWVEDDRGVALVPVASLLSAPHESAVAVDPVLGLLAAPGSAMGSTVTVLWGRAPGVGARLVGRGEETDLAHSFVLPLAPSTVASGQLPGPTLRLAKERLAGVDSGDPR